MFQWDELPREYGDKGTVPAVSAEWSLADAGPGFFRAPQRTELGNYVVKGVALNAAASFEKFTF